MGWGYEVALFSVVALGAWCLRHGRYWEGRSCLFVQLWGLCQAECEETLSAVQASGNFPK
jgi:hypothetical protein